MVIKSHEPAKDRNKQNRENKNRVKKVIDTGKEKGITLETPKTEEQKVSVKKEGDGAEAPKKKKNIIRVYHAQNASDGGKNRKKPVGERKARPQGTRPAAQAQPAAKAEAPVKAAPKTEAPKTEAPKAEEEEEYTYVYAKLAYDEYYAAEKVQNAGSAETSDEVDSRGEHDKGAFDAVTRATTNHGLHRGSFQCTAVIEDTEGKKHYLSHWEGKDQAVMTDGTTYTYAKGVFTAKNGSSFTQKDYEVTGLKYVPVKIRTADLNSLKEKYTVVENGGELIGGYGENQLKSYKTIADVTANTNGLKTAEKQEDGSFAFSARTTGSYSGLKDTQLATADVTPDVKAGDKVGSYGEFIRVDFNGNYGGLGSAMQAVEWTYYGNDDTYTNPVRVFGTKFASDNWMHKSMGIQLGLTDSLRCQLPENTNGTGYWKITIYGLGYADYSYNFEVGTENIATLKTASAEEIAALQAKIDEAKALNRFAYTTDSWKKMQDELE